MMSMRRAAVACILGVALGATCRAAVPDPAPPTGLAILQELKSLQQMATVLMIAAHPDDENTQLIAYLARGRNYRMGYLSVTRGDGGQNVLGGEFGDELGLIRTYELLAARQLDSGRQFFTRAIDFGYSKTPDETLKIWDRDAVLGDVVRVIRTFRPDVLVTRFAPTQTNTHGHHTASAILGVDAFKIAGDANAYPEQLRQGLAPWQPKRILLNAGFGGRGGGGISIDAGGIDPVLNLSYGEIANQSRGMHKSQGLGGGGGGPGRGGGGGASPQSFTLLAGDPASADIMDGIDTTWNRIAGGGAAIAKRMGETIDQFDPGNPAASVPALLDIKKLVDAIAATVPPNPIVTEKRHLLDRIIADCLGLTVETTVPNALVTPGETITLHSTARIRSSIPVRWTQTVFAKGTVDRDTMAISLKPNEAAVREATEVLRPGTPVSQPYWLQQEPAPGIFQVRDVTLIGQPDSPPAYPVQSTFEVGGQMIRLDGQPVQLVEGVPAPQQRRPLAVIAPVSFAFNFDVSLFKPGQTHAVTLELQAARPNTSGTIEFQAPAGWKVEPAAQAFKLDAAESTTKLSVAVTAPANPGLAKFTARAVVGGVAYSNQRQEIAYPHLPALLLQPAAEIKVLAVDVQHKGATIGYLAGAGDSVAGDLAQIGYDVRGLAGKDLTAEGLKGLDAVVIGVRAFNTRTDLAPGLQALFDYVAAGGTVVEQYNRPDQLRNTTLAPYNIRLSTLRVTDETAEVTFLAPDHPALTTPNKITAADFENWVQERNIYLPDQWDGHFTPILGMADPGETPPNSSLLIAQHGKGFFVYTSLVFFRQLPVGNPGAYRLFANLVSLGKP
jgi:LmbE family N-acetylglucosaminyl deacetylase